MRGNAQSHGDGGVFLRRTERHAIVAIRAKEEECCHLRQCSQESHLDAEAHAAICLQRFPFWNKPLGR